jgi:hypothetical protein
MHLVLLDLDHIKDYIYAAPALRPVRGASTLLADFNDREAVAKRATDFGGRLIYAGGGSVLAKFESAAQAKGFTARERDLLDAKTAGGARFTHVVKSADEQKIGNAVLRAQHRLGQAKAARGASSGAPAHFLFKPCEACGSRPAQLRNTHQDLLVCPPCDKRIAAGDREHGNRRALIEQLLAAHGRNSAWTDTEPAPDLQTLAAASRGYVGLIQADGNAMGERLRSLAELEDPSLFKKFSDACRNATEEALLEALRCAYPEPIRVAGETLLPFEPILIGGDDVALIATAYQAIPIARELCTRFTRKMKTFADGCRHPELAVAMSAGVVLAHATHPIRRLDELAGQLLTSAKTLSRQIDKHSLTPTLDYLVVTASTAADLAYQRDHELTDQGRRLVQRPYTSEDLDTLLEAVRKLKYPTGDRAPFPRNKLAELYRIPFRGRDQAILDYLVLRARLSDKQGHRAMLDDLARAGGMLTDHDDGPWRAVAPMRGATGHAADGIQFDTNLLDAVDLYDFIPKPSTSGASKVQAP